MLHKDVLTRLCDARTLLRETSEGRRSMRQIARETGMSLFHFIRLYKAVFGETPKQCQLGARLEHAKHLLMATDFPVTDISMDAGFASLGYFQLRLRAPDRDAADGLSLQDALDDSRPW
jgi:AraC-like DNA-binding protein